MEVFCCCDLENCKTDTFSPYSGIARIQSHCRIPDENDSIISLVLEKSLQKYWVYTYHFWISRKSNSYVLISCNFTIDLQFQMVVIQFFVCCHHGAAICTDTIFRCGNAAFRFPAFCINIWKRSLYIRALILSYCIAVK